MASGTGWASSSPSSTTSTCCVAPRTSTSVSSRRPRLAVTLGDPRGIGPEVVAKAVALGPLDADLIFLGEGTAPRSLLPEEAGRIAGQEVEAAVRLAREGKVDAIVTGPVHKHALHLAGFRYPGLTELLSHLAGDVDVAMMLAAGPLRVVLVTTHIALRDVPAQVTTDRVVRCGRVTERALRDWWGIAAPRLAVCALNPHAGESGLFGDEDARVLEPAARTLGAAGPLPADTVFVRALKGEFDAVLTPYHDVGMTAVKVAGFGTGVNVTLGLPFPRVAPDHGTALDIAGKGVADPGSMRAALELGTELARRVQRADAALRH
ncbi:MAG: 4-hydroxythreonine-4-phosphate dehydrogenase PdxA [Gemmatimonadetes bacterium]|nr:MAG: 4-hydroxythreonine-4-phosphate dehydrogenase PdxA [Gemmatimonadota bacterium]